MDEYVDLALAVIEQAATDYRQAKSRIHTKEEYRELSKHEAWGGKHIAEMLEREAEFGIIPEKYVELFKCRKGIKGKSSHTLVRTVAGPFIQNRKLRAIRVMQEVAGFLKNPQFELPVDTREILKRLEREPYGKKFGRACR